MAKAMDHAKNLKMQRGTFPGYGERHGGRLTMEQVRSSWEVLSDELYV
jgi:hypothetical protein